MRILSIYAKETKLSVHWSTSRVANLIKEPCFYLRVTNLVKEPWFYLRVTNLVKEPWFYP